MTISSEIIQQVYVGAGTVGPFAVPFYFVKDADLKVIKKTIASGAEEVLTLTTDYVVSGANNPAGGSVTLTSTLSSSYKLYIINNPDILQEQEYDENAKFPADTLERGLDLLTIIALRLQQLIGKSIKVSDGTDIDDLVLPIPSPSRLIGWNAGADGLTNYPPVFSVVSPAFTVETHNATAGQTVFNLANSYALGSTNLCVFVNGIKVRVDSDYTETNTTTVTFASGLLLNDQVEFLIGAASTVGTIDAGAVSYTTGGAYSDGTAGKALSNLHSKDSALNISHSVAGDLSLAAATDFRPVHVALTANATSVTMPTAAGGKELEIHFKQDGVGSRTVSGWPGSVRLAGGSLTLTTTPSKIDVLTLRYDALAAAWIETNRSLNM